MRKLKLVEVFMVVCGLCFSNMYASLSEALLDEAQMIIDYGIEGLRAEWSSKTVTSFRNSVEACCKKLQENLPRTNDEHLVLMKVQMESILEIVQELDEFSKERNDDRKQRLELIACNSDSCVQSFILWRLGQIEKGLVENGEQAEEEEDRADYGDASLSLSVPTFPQGKTDSEVVKNGNSEEKEEVITT
ncbi:MAG: hypothetical protein LBF34_03025 [Puniceicoccales bacterium]|jgi:hypothetical protein|nr:hypothetical protein [Puniceicoccales bacterium]